MSKKNRKTRDHDAEFREQAAKMVINEGNSICSTAKNLGIAMTTLHAWVKKFRDGTWTMSDSNSAPTVGQVKQDSRIKLPSSSQKTHDRVVDLETKSRDLEAKLRRMTMERDILKKAMAYCLDAPK